MLLFSASASDSKVKKSNVDIVFNLLFIILQGQLKNFITMYRTPLLSYDLQIVKQNISFFQAIFPTECSIRFATMANIRIEVLKKVFDSGVGFFVNSISHLKLLENLSLTSNGIVYAGSGNSEIELSYIGTTNALYFADSLSQFLAYISFVPHAKVGIRINPLIFNDVGLPFLSRIGFSFDELNSIPKSLMQNIVAVHVYCGTNVASNNIHIAHLKAISEYFYKNENIAYINISGGFPPLNTKHNQNIVKDISRFWYESKFNTRYHLIIEPGRAIVDDAARFFVQVNDLKQVNEEYIAVINSSYTCYPRKILHRINEENITVLGKENIKPSVKYHICGNTTYSNDVLAVCQLPQLNIGDIIVFNNAGAYIENSYISYLGVEKPMVEFK